ncbi:hypothetical protein JST99_02660 [Candidatus Dependentiae bacterium]|nr:hypothetical protein [Candidatus Dependentiae bacterium]MCC7415184.1 hypothetical protein [Campylobacterota bacterium]
MNIKQRGIDLLSVLVFCSWTALTASNCASDRDDYEVKIILSHNVPIDIWYGFYTGSGSKRLAEPTKQYTSSTNNRPTGFTVDRNEFPALQNKQKAMFFVAENKDALDAVLKGSATADQKKLVASKRITSRTGGCCMDELQFIVTKHKGKLGIESKDRRSCVYPASRQKQGSESLLTRIREQGKKIFSRSTKNTEPAAVENPSQKPLYPAASE